MGTIRGLCSPLVHIYTGSNSVARYRCRGQFADWSALSGRINAGSAETRTAKFAAISFASPQCKSVKPTPMRPTIAQRERQRWVCPSGSRRSSASSPNHETLPASSVHRRYEHRCSARRGVAARQCASGSAINCLFSRVGSFAPDRDLCIVEHFQEYRFFVPLIKKRKITEGLTVLVADDEASVVMLFDGPRGGEAACGGHGHGGRLALSLTAGDFKLRKSTGRPS